MKHPRMFTSYVMGLLGLLCAVSQPAFSQDPLKVAPGMYKLLFENERVRVMEVTFKPGESIAPHSHPDHILYAITGGKLSITAGGKTQEANIAAGQTMWTAAETHFAKNVGTSTIRILVTELKEPAPKPGTPKPDTK